MKKSLSAVIIFVLIIFMSADAFAEWVFQFSSGGAINAPTHLKIKQDGEEDIDLTAEYDTKSFSTFAYYYDMRIAKWENGKAWEFETLHHKLHLSNRPDEVQNFVISHGYNLNTINRAWLIDGFIYRLGAGFVMTHPETEVRNKSYSDKGGFNGFHLSGVTAQGGIEKRFPVSEKVFCSLEAKVTASYAEIPVADGDATVPNAALHGIFGLGYKF